MSRNNVSESRKKEVSKTGHFETFFDDFGSKVGTFVDKPRTSSSLKTASETRVFTGFFQSQQPEKVNLLIQTRGLHTLLGDFFEFSGCREPHKPGKGEKMGNLQVTPLHRGHRREGAVLLRFWSAGEMSLLMEKAGSDWSFKVTFYRSESQSCVKDSHRGDVDTQSQNCVANTAR